MNLFFRLVWVFLRASFSSKRIGILDPTVLRHRVWLTDQDMFAHMTNSRYLSFSDLGTINYIIRSNCWTTLRKRGWFPVICAQTMTINRMLKTPQAFELTTRITGWNDTYVGLEHEFRREGRLHATVNVLARFASSKREKVSPDDVLSAVGSTDRSPSLSPTFLSLIQSLESARSST